MDTYFVRVVNRLTISVLRVIPGIANLGQADENVRSRKRYRKRITP